MAGVAEPPAGEFFSNLETLIEATTQRAARNQVDH